MKLNKILTAAALAIAATTSFADVGGGALDLSSGSTFFGRTPLLAFVDTWTFTLTGSSFINSSASSSAIGAKDLDFTSIVLTDAADVTVATFTGNLGTDANEFFVLPVTMLSAGAYKLVVTGVNSFDTASYSGNIAISAVPEPASYALALAGLGAISFVARRRRAA